MAIVMPPPPQIAADLRAWTRFAVASWRTHEASVPDSPLHEHELRRLGLAPLVYRALDAVDDPRAALFRADHRHAATATLIRLSATARLRDLLDARGIPLVLLKGAAFVVRFAADAPGVRPMSDVDWLVPADRATDVAALLRAEGFDTVAPDGGGLTRAIAMSASFVRRGNPMDLEIDLHRELAQWPFHRGLAAQTLAHTEVIDGWRVPSRPDALIVASVHRARHAFVWSCLDLIEVVLLLESMDDDDWRACVSRLVRVGAVGAAYATIRQALHAVDDRSPTSQARLTALAQQLSPRRRRALDRLAPLDGVFLPPLAQERPLVRNFVVQPAVTGSYWQSMLAAVSHLPLRTLDEWRQPGDARRTRLVRIWHHVTGGARRARISGHRPPPVESPTPGSR